MRPQYLTFSGLRSYLETQEIDLTGRSLIAIVGDTGAGKSSILEAINVALYGVSSWNQNLVRDLIADGADRLVVRLTFGSGNKTWQVTRSVSRSRGATHGLKCLDDGRTVDGKTAVNNAIQAMTRLNHSAFLKAAVLPQGKYQALLHSTVAERTPVLKSILGIDDLEGVQKAVTDALVRMRPALAELRRQRDLLPPDPARTAAEARAEESAASDRRDDLTDVRSRVERAVGARDTHHRRAENLGDVAQQLAAGRLSDASPTLRNLAARDEELSAEQSEVNGAIASGRRVLSDTDALLAERAERGLDRTTLITAAERLSSAITQLPQLEAERDQLAEEDERLACLDSDLAEAEKARNELALAAESAKTIAGTAAEDVGRARDGLADGRLLLERARAAERAFVEAECDYDELAERLVTLREEGQTTAEELTARAQGKARTAANLDTVRRAEAAAHAAAASRPGDPCPICERALPDGFTPPSPPALATAMNADDEATLRLTEAEAASRRSQGEIRHAEADLARRADTVERTRLHRDDALALLRAPLPTAALDHTDDDILEPLTSIWQNAEDTRNRLDHEARDAADTHTHAAVGLREQRKAQQDRVATQAANRSALDTRFQALQAGLAALPAPHRADGPPSISDLTTRRQRVEVWTAELDAIVQSQEKDREALAEHLDRRQELMNQHLAEVERPRNRVQNALANLVDLAMDTAKLLGQAPVPPPMPEDGADEAWALVVDEAIGEILAATDLAQRQASKAAAQSASEADAALAEGGVGSRDELHERIVDAAADVRDAARRAEQAERQVPLAADLDRRRDAVTPIIDALTQIDEHLTDGRFSAAVVARRQRTLLGLASDQLLEMTQGHFAFQDDFQIADLHTGTQRDVRTLSGGETFQASLALALASVEMAGRAGGRVDALFLDEGFGSLDTNALAASLDVLTRQTLGGRLVAVVSHMRAVAENIDDVLLVSRTTSGTSQARWLSPDERSALMDDVAGGLLG